LPKGSTITPTTVDGVTTSVITTPNSALTVKNQTELDDILSSIKKNMDIVNTISLRTGQTAKNNAKRQIELLKNDLSRYGYEYKQGSSGLFLVKI
jgi:hypothetical protein